jgi:hypothetical protein
MFKVSMRELLLMVTLVAVACSWWVDHRKISEAADENNQMWIEECNCRLVKSLWLRDWIESNGLGEVEGLETLFANMTVTSDGHGKSRTFRWGPPATEVSAETP